MSLRRPFRPHPLSAPASAADPPVRMPGTTPTACSSPLSARSAVYSAPRRAPHSPDTDSKLRPHYRARDLLPHSSNGTSAGRKARRQLLQSDSRQSPGPNYGGPPPPPPFKHWGFWSGTRRPLVCLPSALGLRPSEAARSRRGLQGRPRAGASRPPSSRRAPRRRAEPAAMLR